MHVTGKNKQYKSAFTCETCEYGCFENQHLLKFINSFEQQNLVLYFMIPF